MASIQKLSIQGIRSFSPNQEMNIEFYSPLTMIVGANGCGKTSIIESLKYACTGALPPTCRNGQSFVNDPTMTDSTEVKACVKLKFTNKANKPTVCIRSMQLSKKKSKLEFKALDGCIRTVNELGEKVSTSHKCSELDRHVPELLGVSPAIMENVIFCHQEDSSWPMGEGIVLKKKFDDVFESTRYTKALEAIQKAKKEYLMKGKDLKAELGEFGAHLIAANEMKRELETAEENQESCQQDLDVVAEKLQRNVERRERCQEVLRRAEKRSSELQTLQWKVAEAERRLQEKESSVKQVMTESDGGLQNLLENFETEMRLKSQQHKELQQAVDHLNSSMATLRGETDRLNTARGEASALNQQVKTSRDAVLEMIRQNARKNQLDDLGKAPPDVTITDMKDFLQALNNKIQTMRAESQGQLKTLRDAVEASEKKCNVLRGQLQRLDVEADAKKSEVERLQADNDAKVAEMSRLNAAKTMMKNMEEDYAKLKQSDETSQQNFDTKGRELRLKIKETSDEIKSLKDQIDENGELLRLRNLNRSDNEALRAVEKQVAQERADLNEVTANALQQHREVLRAVQIAEGALDSGEARDGVAADSALELLQSAGDRIAARVSDLRRALKDKQEELAKHGSELGGTKALLDQQEAQVHSLRNRLGANDAGLRELATIVDGLRGVFDASEARGDNRFLDAEVFSIDRSSPVLAVLELASSYEKELLQSRDQADYVKKAIRKLKRSMEKENKCPCCTKQVAPEQKGVFNSSVEVHFKGVEAEDQLKSADHFLGLVTPWVATLRDLAKVLGPTESVRGELRECETKVAELRRRRVELEEGERAVREGVEGGDREVKATDRAAGAVVDLLQRWRRFRDSVGDFEDQRKKRQQSQSMSLVGADDGRSIEEIESEQLERTQKKDELTTKKENLTTQESHLQKQLSTHKMQLLEADSKLQMARQSGQRHSDLEATVKVQRERCLELEGERRSLANQKDDVQRLLSAAEQLLVAAKAEQRHWEEVSGAQLSGVLADRDGLLREVEGLAGLERRAQHKDLRSVVSDLEHKQALIADKEAQVRAKVPQMHSLNADLSSQENHRRNIKDNLDLREVRRELSRLTKDLDTLKKDIDKGAGAGGGQSLHDAQRDAQRISQEDERLKTERATLNGRMEIYRSTAVEKGEQLNKATYRGVEERHRRKGIEYETTMMAVDDLGCYYDALDSALQNFHTLKIRDINKIIRELWQLIYKGQDIEMIELESGQETAVAAGGTGGATARGSRSYSYRVVMRKGDVPLDMRGRCSAGQRVLAAIVIRLALAETFGLNCGILALDEPTTNLDEQNKQGLAHALAKIILDRSRQLNFQLICITHDEEFVRLISSELAASAADFALPEYFFRVTREEDEGEGGARGKKGGGKFFSRIERERWENLSM